MRKILDFDNTYHPEDRWLRFAIRLSFVLFLVGLQVIVIMSLIVIIGGSR